MKNRAKCKLCNSILESFHEFDYVTCACGEISISGGKIKLECFAKNWENFMRIDDKGNTIIPTVKEKDEIALEVSEKIGKKEKIDMLEGLIKGYENLPKHAFTSPASNMDLYHSLILILSIFKEDLKI